jgi:tRNA 2-thiouridine synthesizing protein A
MERVDVTGEVCPRPALIVRRRLADLDPGEELLVRGDYPPAEENLERTCRKHGFEVTDAGSEDGHFRLRVAVTEDAAVQ